MLSKVRKKLKTVLLPMGFGNIGNCYYVIKNDIAFCLSFDMPSGIVYCTFHIIPLYLPCVGRYYTYGDRLNGFQGSSVGLLLRTASDEEIDEWVENLLYTLKTLVFPFFEKISTPLKLRRFIDSDPAVGQLVQYFHCPPDHLDRLRVFSCLYLDDRDALTGAIKQAYDSLSRANYYTDRIKEERKHELLKIEACLSDPAFCGSRFCAKIVDRSLECCFGKAYPAGDGKRPQ